MPTYEQFKQHFAVELFIFIHMFGVQFYTLATVSGVYWKVCVQKYGDDASVDCVNLKESGEKEYEDAVQKETSNWLGLSSILASLPTIFIDPLFGAYADKVGRKTNILIAVLGHFFKCIIFIAMFTWPRQVPMVLLPIASFIAAFSGSILPHLYAYIADHIDDRSLLAQRFALLAASIGGATMFGAFAASPALKQFSYAKVLLFPTAIAVLAIVYAYFVFEQQPPPHQPDKDIPAAAAASLQKGDKSKTCNCSSLKYLKNLGTDLFETLTQKRTGNLRLYIVLLLIAALLQAMADYGIPTVLNLFCLRNPIGMTQAVYSTYTGVNTAIQVLGGTVVLIVLRRVFRIHETIIICLSNVSSIGRMVLIGASTTVAMVYVAAAVGVAQPLMSVVQNALMTQFVSPDEIGKAYALLASTGDMASIFSAIVLNGIYTGTLEWFAGFVFIFAAAISGVVLVIMAVVLFDRRRQIARKSKVNAASLANGVQHEVPTNEKL